MNRKALITLILGTALAVVPAAQAVVLSDGSGGAGTVAFVPTSTSTNLSPAEYQALQIRGEALNQQYGNALTRLTPQEFKSVTQSGLTPDELVGAVARGQALNEQYGTSVSIRPDVLGGDGGESTSPISTSTGNSIGWNAGIAGAALAGAMLLALGFAMRNRRRHQLSF
jgi:hypothetical protein